MKVAFELEQTVNYTGQSLSLIGRVPIEILSEKRHITKVSTVSFSPAEFQMEPLPPNAFSYDTRPATY